MELEPAARSALLGERCKGDRELRDAVEAMLERIDSDESAAGDAVASLTSSASGAPGSGDSVGGFSLQELLGSGGMGEVYRAVRDDAAFEQTVALKLLRAQILTPDLRLRFNQEREILARLRHPYIAGLIDGGTTESGVPFLVMELVDGLPIDAYCDQNRLSINERLALLEKVALALQHAHQNLIIHRDLKPSNVLVTVDGIPKLVDFGIAKLLADPEHSDEPQHGATTFFGNRAFTPDFASPEQILTGDVSTSSDVYSLGVLALTVLTGQRPYDASRLPARELVALMETTTMPRASTLLTRPAENASIADLAEARRSTPARLRRLITRDLDTVLAMATHREAERRYPSAEAFARDLANVRRGAQVLARGDSMAYRSWSLVRANRLLFSVVGTTVVALSVGLIVALWQARIADQRFTDLHSFARSVLGEIYDSVSDLPGSTPTRRLIAQEAQHYLDRLANSGIDDVQLQQDLALAYKRLADVQGLPTNANLGDSVAALENYRKAQIIAERTRDNSAEATSARAELYRRMGDVLAWQGEVEAARTQLEQSLGMFRALLQQNPNESQALINVAYNLVKLGDTLGHPSFPNLGDPSGATAAYAEARDLLAPHSDDPGDWELQRSFSVALERAGVMALLREDIEKALEFFTHSREVRMALADARPDHTDIQRDAGVASEKLADVYRARQNTDQALVYYTEALAVYEALAEIDPDNANAMRTLAIGRENLAEALVDDGNVIEARAQYAAAEQIRARLTELDPENARLRAELTSTREQLAQLERSGNSRAVVTPASKPAR